MYLAHHTLLIKQQVFNLKEIFRKGDPIADRKRGAQIIGALVRGFLARQVRAFVCV